METEQHYFRVGVYIVALTAGLMLFAAWLMSDGIDDSNDYRIYFAESVSGLSLGSPVKYRGVNVGQVMDIAIDKKDPRYIRTTVAIRDDTPVTVGMVASLKLQGITGAVYVELSGGQPGAQDLAESQPKNRVPVIPSEASSINAIMMQLPQIMDKLSHFADQLAKLSTDENIAQFSETLSNLHALTGNLNGLTSDTRKVLRNTKGNIIESTEQMNATMGNLRKASRDISNVTDRVEEDPSSLIFGPDEEGIPAP